MKYKVGDVVRLKSAEELIKLGTWSTNFADYYGGKTFRIKGIVESYYIIGNITIDDDSIDCLVRVAEETTYTFDELKKRVDALKDYATKLSSELNIGLSIDLETEIECDDWNRKSAKGFSRINIMY